MAHSNTRCRRLLPITEIGRLAIQSAAVALLLLGLAISGQALEMCFPAKLFVWSGDICLHILRTELSCKSVEGVDPDPQVDASAYI